MTDLPLIWGLSSWDLARWDPWDPRLYLSSRMQATFCLNLEHKRHTRCMIGLMELWMLSQLHTSLDLCYNNNYYKLKCILRMGINAQATRWCYTWAVLVGLHFVLFFTCTCTGVVSFTCTCRGGEDELVLDFFCIKKLNNNNKATYNPAHQVNYPYVWKALLYLLTYMPDLIIF